MDLREEIIKILMDLIRFETTHERMDEIENCSLYIEKFLDENKIPFEKIVNNGYPSILVTPEKRSSEILFMSHMDVVDGEKELFEPYMDGDRLYGRGSVDDKYAIALSLLLLKKFYTETSSSKVPFGVLVTSDEEIGGESGAGEIIKDIKTDFCVILDGGNPQKIVVKEKGLIKVKITAKGKSAHGSRPWLGENAIDNLIDDYSSLKTLFTEENEGNWNKTINFGVVKAGQAHNKVPGEAIGIFDIRYTENDDPNELINEMKKVVKGELTIEATGSLFSCKDNKYLDSLKKISSAETGTEHGASDARFVSEYGIDGVVWGAEGNKSQHSKSEHVEIQSIIKLYQVFDTFIQEYSKQTE